MGGSGGKCIQMIKLNTDTGEGRCHCKLEQFSRSDVTDFETGIYLYAISSCILYEYRDTGAGGGGVTYLWYSMA